MSSPSRRHRANHDIDAAEIAAINTTPLVDVMLVLLIIFIITIPIALKSTPVALPLAQNPAAPPSPPSLTLTINALGVTYWNQQKLASPEALAQKLQQLAKIQPQTAVYLHGARDAPYAYIGQVLFALQQAGLSKVSFVTLPHE